MSGFSDRVVIPRPLQKTVSDRFHKRHFSMERNAVWFNRHDDNRIGIKKFAEPPRTAAPVPTRLRRHQVTGIHGQEAIFSDSLSIRISVIHS